jgi:hypothetical protein
MNTLSIVTPVFNEMLTIERLLDRVRMAPALELKKELIVVDDCSTDGTREYLQRLTGDDIICLFHERNRGKGPPSGPDSRGPQAMSSSSRTRTSSTTRTSILSSCDQSWTVAPTLC